MTKPLSNLRGLPSLAACLFLTLATSCTSVQADLVLPDGVQYAQPVEGADSRSRQVGLRRVSAIGWIAGTATVVGLIPCIAANNTRETVELEIPKATLEKEGIDPDRVAEILDRGWNRLRGTLRVANLTPGSGECRIDVPMRKFVDAAVSGTAQHYTPAQRPYATLTIQRAARP